jgi:hypothetical protein
MKVVCINGDWENGDLMPCPKEKEIYHVIEESNCPDCNCGEVYYTLEEFGEIYLWNCRNFIPLSNIDETKHVNKNWQPRPAKMAIKKM